MFPFCLKEDQTIWAALGVSLLIHGSIFILSGKTFIPQAQFSVQPAVQTVEVSLEEIHYSPSVQEQEDGTVKTPQKKVIKETQTIKGSSGVKTKANPDYFQNPAPIYPELAKQMRQEGLVMLNVDVDSQGSPIKVEIVQSSGFRLLDQAALKTVSHWKFQPGRIGNLAIESQVRVPVRFKLEIN